MTLIISDTQHNNSLHYAGCRCAECRILFTVSFRVIILSCHYAECHYAECRGAFFGTSTRKEKEVPIQFFARSLLSLWRQDIWSNCVCPNDTFSIYIQCTFGNCMDGVCVQNSLVHVIFVIKAFCNCDICCVVIL
jgi:hypothetical protein